MIVRHLNGYYYLFSQLHHARHTAQILAALKDDAFGPYSDRATLLRAAHDHDEGWRLWEESPRFAPNGLPINFTEMDKDEHDDIWNRGIFSALRQIGPEAAVYIARHSQAVMAHDGDAIPEDEQDLLKALQNRAWPDVEQSVRERNTRNGYQPLFFSDGLSLLALAGWNTELEFKLPSMSEEYSVKATRIDDWTVQVDPWPFVLDSIKDLRIDGYVVHENQIHQTAEILKEPREHRIRIQTQVVPLGYTGEEED